jgi:hypothetical protein
MPRSNPEDETDKLIHKISNAALKLEQTWVDDNGLDINQLSIIEASVAKLNKVITNLIRR